VPYVHVVFTLPHQLNSLIRANEDVLYGMIMRSSWATIKTECAKEENVGGLPGMTAVLHTFGSDIRENGLREFSEMIVTKCHNQEIELLHQQQHEEIYSAQ